MVTTTGCTSSSQPEPKRRSAEESWSPHAAISYPGSVGVCRATLERGVTMSVPHILALHLTSPSGSEAKVLASLLQHKDADIRATLIVNARAGDDEHSHFRQLDDDPSVTVIPCEVGLPVDHWKPDSAILRLLHRGSHIPRRLSILRLARRLQPDVIYTSQQRFDCRIGSILSRSPAAAAHRPPPLPSRRITAALCARAAAHLRASHRNQQLRCRIGQGAGCRPREDHRDP